ncbi:MAG: beta-galactosidase, partial [Verrucomicrobia bacterium]|nr:beta-galactosidase [Verrucomicrobiota bacterium]
LGVVLNLIPEGAPYWLERRLPEAAYKANDGYQAEFSGAANMPSGGWPGLCRDNSNVAAFANRFLEQVASRYRERPNLVAFDVWNEPHIDPAFDYPAKLFCYCEASLARFVAWLTQKYGSLEGLNKSWHRAYAEWDDVKAPTRFGTYPDMMDWRMFWLENHAQWLEARVGIVKRVAPKAIAMTHVPFSGYFGGSGKGGLGQTLTDEFLLATKIEQFGLTSFPKWLMGNDPVQHLFNIEMVGAAAELKDFWQSELQSGGGLWGAYGSEVATPDELRLWTWGALAAGAKGVMFWQWRPEPSGLESPGFGLTTIDGLESPRTKAAKTMGLYIAANPSLAEAARMSACNAIYISRTADLFFFAADRGERVYADALFGVYRSFLGAGLPVRFIHSDAILQGTTPRPEVLYVPAALALSDGEIASLEAWIRCGTTVVVEACTGLFDATGTLRSAPRSLEEAAGLAAPEIGGVEFCELHWTDRDYPEPTFTGRFYRQDFSSRAQDVEILAQFSDGRPAIYRRQIELGKIVWVCSLCSVAARGQAVRPSSSPVTRWACEHGYKELRSIRAPGGVFARLHRLLDDSLILIAVNHGTEPATIQVELAADREATNPVKFHLGPYEGELWRL